MLCGSSDITSFEPKRWQCFSYPLRATRNDFSHSNDRYLPLEWRHNERNGVSNHRRIDCLLNRLFRHRSKKTSKLCVTRLCEGKSPVTGEFPAQRDSNAENISIWWRHHASTINEIWDEITYSLRHCNGAEGKVCKWISLHIIIFVLFTAKTRFVYWIACHIWKISPRWHVSNMNDSQGL